MTMQPPSLMWLFFSFAGRIARKSFGIGVLFLVFPQVFIVIQLIKNEQNPDALAFWGFMILLVWGAALWSLLALSAKRLHDLGVTGWLSILVFIPAVSWLFLLALVIIPSSRETNEHGPPPFAD